MISTHPVGVFFSRLNHNFQLESSKKINIAFNLSNGNVWLPDVKAYIPELVEDKNKMKNILWHEREHYFNTSSSARFIELHADGVIRFYQVKLEVPVSKNQEIKINMRAFSLDAGNFPYSTLTSDRFIEWVHSNISGGEDPFARRKYGFNKANILYTDFHGKSFHLESGDFIFSGIELTYYYYPKFKYLLKRNMFLNFGLLNGVNTSIINPSIDLGISASMNKKSKFSKGRNLQFGLSFGFLKPKLFMLTNGVELINAKYLLSTEGLFNYQKCLSKNRSFSIGLTYFIQSPYNQVDDYESMVLTGNRFSSHWHYAISHLYRMTLHNTFFLSYAVRKVSLSVYLREDSLVDNAPDVQAGFGIRYLM